MLLCHVSLDYNEPDVKILPFRCERKCPSPSHRIPESMNPLSNLLAKVRDEFWKFQTTSPRGIADRDSRTLFVYIGFSILDLRAFGPYSFRVVTESLLESPGVCRFCARNFSGELGGTPWPTGRRK
jgi:hypothetical protein